MSENTKNNSTESNVGAPQNRRVISMRLIVTVTAVLLIAGAVIGVGSLAERQMRKTLNQELETRLLLEARNLAFLSSTALLSDFPELTLHPVVKEMKSERPDLSMVFVIDHSNVIQGHEDIGKLGTPYSCDIELQQIQTNAKLRKNEILLGNSDLMVVQTPVLHPNGKQIGTAIVGLERSFIKDTLKEAREKQLILLFPILAISILVTLILMSRLLKPISVLREGLMRIGKGDLNAQVKAPSSNELGLLANSINEMTKALRTAQEELLEKERLDREMELAKEIQLSLLPGESLSAGDFVIAGSHRAAEEVGGDYYNVFPLKDGRLGVVIADVAGKGLGGCLVTSMLDVLVRTLSSLHRTPKAMLVALENALVDSLQPGTFVTAFYGILDPTKGILTYASAGHNPILHYIATDRDVKWHKSKGIPLALVRGGALKSSLENYKLELAPGDLLIETTDGFNEAFNETQEEYGFQRIEDVVKKSAPQGCHAVILSLQHSVEKWERGMPASDDKTLLVISRLGGPAINGINGDLNEENLKAISSSLNMLWKQRTGGNMHLTMPAKLESLHEIGNWLRSCDCIGKMQEDDIGLLEQGLYELCANIAEHGCKLDPYKTIDVWWVPFNNSEQVKKNRDGKARDVFSQEDNGECENLGYFLVRDYGVPPDPENWPVIDLDSKLVQSEGRGLGLNIIRKITETIEYHANTGFGNITVIRFKIPRYQLT